MNKNTNVLDFNLSSANAKRIIVGIAKESKKVFFTDHAEQRMKQRKITRIQVLKCLQHGSFTEGPYRDIKGKLITTDHDGKIVYKNTFATNHAITSDNVADVVRDGWARWKVENENNNTLKTKGYHLSQ